MSISRDWTADEADPRWEDEDYYDRVRPILDHLAKEWSRLRTIDEQSGFQRQWDREEGLDGYDWEPEEQAFFDAQRRLQDRLLEVQIEEIENQLESYGARMMRPYEHWNEDEKYMAYMERDR